MKKYSYILLLACVAGLLFSSCSSIENISVTKRHYRGGYNIDFGSSTQTAKADHASQPAPVVAAETTPVAPETPSTAAVTTPEKKQQAAVVPSTEKQSVKKSQPYASNKTSSEMTTVKKEAMAEQMNNVSQALPSEKDTKDELPYWAMILFCILLPPLAVGLKFGISTEFWISLILTLLFWIPGVIYALILIID